MSPEERNKYALVEDVEVRVWKDELAGMPFDLYDDLAVLFGEPVVGYVGGLHYYFKPMWGIPADTAAVPKHKHGEECKYDGLLILK